MAIHLFHFYFLNFHYFRKLVPLSLFSQEAGQLPLCWSLTFTFLTFYFLWKLVPLSLFHRRSASASLLIFSFYFFNFHFLWNFVPLSLFDRRSASSLFVDLQRNLGRGRRVPWRQLSKIRALLQFYCKIFYFVINNNKIIIVTIIISILSKIRALPQFYCKFFTIAWIVVIKYDSWDYQLHYHNCHHHDIIIIIIIITSSSLQLSFLLT